MASDLVPGARYAVAPAQIVATAWPRIEKTSRNIGWLFDPWQRATGRLILSKRADGGWASDLSILSIPRQVGKSYLLGCIIFVLCLLQPKLRVIWTSHHTATTEEMYESMKELAQHKRVAPHVLKCIALQGSRWRIQFRNGSRIDFGARERGFGRGKAKVGVLVLDEFQHISMRALSNLTPTTNTADNPLILCAGTPPSEQDNAEAFRGRRKSAIDGISKETVYVEFSADPDADLDDRKQWAKANPSFPKRTPERAFLLNRKILDDENFRREFLGVWDDDDGGGYFTPGRWLAGAAKGSQIDGPLALGLAVSVDRKRAVIGAVGRNKAGSIHFEPVWFGSPAAAAAEASELVSRHSAVALAIAGGGPGADLVPALEKLVPASVLAVMRLDDEKTAASEVYDLVEAVGHAHLDDADLNGAVRVAVRKDASDRFVIGRRKSTGDTAPFEAVAYAAWALGRHKTYNVLDSVL